LSSGTSNKKAEGEKRIVRAGPSSLAPKKRRKRKNGNAKRREFSVLNFWFLVGQARNREPCERRATNAIAPTHNSKLKLKTLPRPFSRLPCLSATGILIFRPVTMNLSALLLPIPRLFSP
jgi:hypothetical protein